MKTKLIITALLSLLYVKVNGQFNLIVGEEKDTAIESFSTLYSNFCDKEFQFHIFVEEYTKSILPTGMNYYIDILDYQDSVCFNSQLINCSKINKNTQYTIGSDTLAFTIPKNSNFTYRIRFAGTPEIQGEEYPCSLLPIIYYGDDTTKLILVGSGTHECFVQNLNSTNNIENNEHIIIKPNPAQNLLYVEGITIQTNYSVINNLGQILNSGELSPDNYTIPVENLKTDTYFLILEINDKRILKKIVIV